MQSIRYRRKKLAADRAARQVAAVLESSEILTAPGVWAITIVRDEADVIGLAVDHLLAQGVCHVLAVDHMSNDDTPRILAERDDVTVIPYRHDAFYQGAIMTVLARHAARFGAEWIVPFDADEVWWTSDGTPLAEHLLSRTDDVVEGAIWDYVPTSTDGSDDNPFRRLIHRSDKPAPMPQVAFRASPRIAVLEGNHGVRPAGKIGSGLVVAHYPFRSREQFVRKLVQGNAGISATRLDRGIAVHWRELGTLDAEELGKVWDDFGTTHQLPHSLWRAPEVLVRDPEARSLRYAIVN